MTFSLPSDVQFIISTLENYGYEAYVVGGCVRDSLLGIEPNDWDITTSAYTDEIKSCFDGYQLINVGEKHGTIGVVLGGVVYEVTTYRIDGRYDDNRRPESVEFTDDINLDLARRDFTVNAMAYNEKVGLVDPYNGERDLQYLALRCVGDPDTRFGEDALRILRALRFASVYNFSIEPNTSASLLKNRSLLNNISVERIASEFGKLLCGENVNFILKRYKDIFAVFIPEIVATFNCGQNTPHHNKTVWRHTAAAVGGIEPDELLRTVMFFHDIGKPLALHTDSKGVDHFKGHNHFSAILARNILERLKYPSKFIENTVVLIENHDVRFSDNKIQIKHILKSIGVENFERLMKIQLADIMAQSKFRREEKLANHELTEATFKTIVENHECFKLKDLAINGSDLIHIGITQGQMIGKILNFLLDSVIDETVDNEKKALIAAAREYYNF